MEWPSKWNSWRKKVSISVKINKANLQWGFNLRQWVDAETQWGSLAFTCNRRVAMWTGSLATQLFKYICFVVPGAGGNGAKTAHTMLIQTSMTKILITYIRCAVFHVEKTEQHVSLVQLSGDVSKIPSVPHCPGCWMSGKETSHRFNIKRASIQSVLPSKGKKPRCTGRLGPFLICEQEHCWIFRKSSLKACVRKIAEFTKGSNEIGSVQTQLQDCGTALYLCHKFTVWGKGKCLFKEHGDQPCSLDHKTERSLSLLIICKS